MFGILKSTVIVGLLAALTSCGILSGSKKRAEQPLHDVQKLVDPKTGKEVVIVRMRHLGPQAGYDQVRDYLDKLKTEGYVTFYEGIAPVPFHIDTIGDVTTDMILHQVVEFSQNYSAADSIRLVDTLYRKSRRMIGFSIFSKDGYADQNNKSLKIKETEKEYISQNKDILGLTTDRDIWVDYSLHDQIEICEKKYGEIELTDYDFQTGLFEKYAPEKRPNQRASSYFTRFSRNDYVVRRVAESKHPRIAVVYGAAHSFGIVYDLKKKHGFRIEKGYKAE